MIVVSILLGFLLSQTETADAEVNCTSATSCIVTNLPAYNQNSPGLMIDWSNAGGTGTMLCIPTAVAMALSSLTDANYYINGGTISAQFKSLSADDRVRLMAAQMGTTRAGGTYWSAMKTTYTGRATDFNPAFSTSVTSNSTTTTVGPGEMARDLSSGKVPAITYGHYTPTCTNLASGELSCSYVRTGGHGMAVRGVNGSTVTFADPWNARTFDRAVIALPKNDPKSGAPLIHLLPSTFSVASTTQHSWSTTYAAFMEGIISVGNAANLTSTSAQPRTTASVDTAGPTTYITSPSAGALIPKYSYMQVQAQASDASGVKKVEFYGNGNLRCTVTAAPYTCTWRVSRYANHSIKLTTRAYDNAGNVSVSAAVTVKTY